MEGASELNINLDIKVELSKKSLIIKPGNGQHKYTLIWLHGLTMSVEKFYNFFFSEEMIHLLEDFKVILPQSPIAPVTMEGGKHTFSWFDVIERKFGKPFDELFGRQEVIDNSKTITSIIEQEVQSYNGDYSKVFLGGFSQGCAMALHVGLSVTYQLGGIIGYSGYFFEITPIPDDDRKVLVIHGGKDSIRPWEQVKPTYKKIENNDNVEFLHFKKMGHDLYTEEARSAVHNFIRERCQQKKFSKAVFIE